MSLLSKAIRKSWCGSGARSLASPSTPKARSFPSRRPYPNSSPSKLHGKAHSFSDYENSQRKDVALEFRIPIPLDKRGGNPPAIAPNPKNPRPLTTKATKPLKAPPIWDDLGWDGVSALES